MDRRPIDPSVPVQGKVGEAGESEGESVRKLMGEV
jgi:hypothetical protein